MTSHGNKTAKKYGLPAENGKAGKLHNRLVILTAALRSYANDRALTILLGVNTQRSVWHYPQTFFGNKLASNPADAVDLVLNA